MATFRFLHCADLHLDSPLRGLEADPDAPVDKIRGATRDAFRNLVDYALEQHVDFVVAAGDLYDGDWQDWRTGQFLIGQIARLANAKIPFIAISGNHDAASVITRNLRMPAEIAWKLGHARPETIRLSNVPVSVHGQSFANRAVTENLARGYPPPDPDRFNIGLLHSAVDGRFGHEPYAPCSIDDLRGRDYQYWALGHVHNRRTLHTDPWIVFPGNIQGRDISETGAKGASLVTVTDNAVSGEPIYLSFDTVRWDRVTIELTEEADEDIALSRVRSALSAALEQTEGRLLATRITLTGACLAHETFSRDLGAARERVRAEALSVAGPGSIWTEKIDIATRPLDTRPISDDDHSAHARLLQSLRATGATAIGDDIRAYAVKMLEKENTLRKMLGEDHSASIAAIGDNPDDLISRARDLLLGILEA